MKKVLLVLGFITLFYGTSANAEVVEEVQNNTTLKIDFEESFTEKRTRSGDSYIHIDGEAWDQAVKDSYKEAFPEYEGDVKITDIETGKEISFDDTVKKQSVDDILNRAFTNVSTKGTPNSSVGKVYLYFYEPNGQVVASSGSAFKIKDNFFGTAGHVVYEKQYYGENGPGLGWVRAGAVNFELTPAPTGGAYATANYNITATSTNADWMNSSLHGCWRSDFGSITGRLISGKVPPNLSVVSDAPTSVSGRAFGYPGDQSAATFSIGSGNLTATNDSTWHNWMYVSSNTQIKRGMSGGPIVNSSNQVIGINSNGGKDAYGNAQYRFVRLRPTIYNSWFK